MSSMGPDTRGDAEAVDGSEFARAVATWEHALNDLAGGALSLDLHPVGGVEEYIATSLRDAEHPASERLAFLKALDNVVQVWQPRYGEPAEHVLPLLQLIRAHTPWSGFVKVLGFLRSWGSFGSASDAARRTDRRRDPTYVALGALARYFPVPPVPPVDVSPAFKSYVSYLRDLLQVDSLAGVAAVRLVELEILELEAPTIRTVIESSTEGLHDLVAFALAREGVTTTASRLAALYTHCLLSSKDLGWAFEDVLPKLGARLVHEIDPPRPAIVLLDPDGRQVGFSMMLTLPERAHAPYFKLRAASGDEHGLEQLDRLLSRGSGASE